MDELSSSLESYDDDDDDDELELEDQLGSDGGDELPW